MTVIKACLTCSLLMLLHKFISTFKLILLLLHVGIFVFIILFQLTDTIHGYMD